MVKRNDYNPKVNSLGLHYLYGLGVNKWNAMKVKAKNGKLYDMSKKRVCKKCLGKRVIYIPSSRSYKTYGRDMGSYVPCTCNETKTTSTKNNRS